MTLQRLAGYGPIAAFVSAGGLFVYAIFQVVPVPANLLNVALPVLFLSMFAWAAGLTVTVVDLQWMEHPATSTRWIRAALLAAIAAMVAPLLMAFGIYTNLGYPYTVEVGASLLLLGIGFSILVHSLEARRTRLLHGALPWIGIVTGVCFLYLGILQFIYMFTPVLVMGFVYAFQPSLLLYFIWAIWMGVHLVRSKAPAPAKAAVPAAS